MAQTVMYLGKFVVVIKVTTYNIHTVSEWPDPENLFIKKVTAFRSWHYGVTGSTSQLADKTWWWWWRRLRYRETPGRAETGAPGWSGGSTWPAGAAGCSTSPSHSPSTRLCSGLTTSKLFTVFTKLFNRQQLHGISAWESLSQLRAEGPLSLYRCTNIVIL